MCQTSVFVPNVHKHKPPLFINEPQRIMGRANAAESERLTRWHFTAAPARHGNRLVQGQTEETINNVDLKKSSGISHCFTWAHITHLCIWSKNDKNSLHVGLAAHLISQIFDEKVL